MKKLLILIPIFLVLLASGCTTQDPKEIVKQSIEKLEKLESYKIDYNMSLEMYGISLEGDAIIYKKGENTRADVIMSVMGQETTTSTYSLPSGIYTCAEALGNMTCVKGEMQSILSPEQSVEMNTKLIEKGVINLKFNEIKKIAGRNCYSITSNFNTSKLDEVEPEDLKGLGIEDMITLGYMDIFKKFAIVQCYDFETGMPLEISIEMEIDTSKMPETSLIPGNMKMSIGMTAKSFEPDIAVDDSKFELPVEPIDMSDLQELAEPETCTDYETGETMGLEEARDIALGSECMANGTIVEGSELCNNYTGTWWFDLDLEMENCYPACVVSVANRTAEINWRCTGLIIPENQTNQSI